MAPPVEANDYSACISGACDDQRIVLETHLCSKGFNLIVIKDFSGVVSVAQEPAFCRFGNWLVVNVEQRDLASLFS